jgi:hypothetical protein
MDTGNEWEEEVSSSQEDDVIAEDMPCIRCFYNLRGLREEGRCPECGTAIEKTVAYVMQRVLCATCMAPNHPSLAMCMSCGSPLTGEAATANYFRTTAIAGGCRKKRDYEEEPDPPSAALMGVCWTLGIFGIVEMGVALSRLWEVAPGWGGGAEKMGEKVVWTVLMAMGTFVLLVMMYFTTREYGRKRRAYLVKHAAFMEKERAADEAEAAAKRTRRLSGEDDEDEGQDTEEP